MALTVPCVPTGIKTGVSITTPLAVTIRPRRAPVAGHVRRTWKLRVADADDIQWTVTARRPEWEARRCGRRGDSGITGSAGRECGVRRPDPRRRARHRARRP